MSMEGPNMVASINWALFQIHHDVRPDIVRPSAQSSGFSPRVLHNSGSVTLRAGGWGLSQLVEKNQRAARGLDIRSIASDDVTALGAGTERTSHTPVRLVA